MAETVASLANSIGGLAALILAILYIAYAVRNDTAKTLATRVGKLETQLVGEVRRRIQLENILRTNGIQVPPWDNYPDPPVTL